MGALALSWAPTTAVQLTRRAVPSIEYTTRKISVYMSLLAATGSENGQMTKLPTVVDSLRNPVALGRTPVLVVGMLSWHALPGVTTFAPTAVASAAGVATRP